MRNTCGEEYRGTGADVYNETDGTETMQKLSPSEVNVAGCVALIAKYRIAAARELVTYGF